MLLQVPTILKTPICIEENEQSFAWLRVKECGGSVKRAPVRELYCIAQRLRVKNTYGGTDLFRCTKCTTKRMNKKRAHCDRKDIFAMEKATNTKVIDKYILEIFVRIIFS